MHILYKTESAAESLISEETFEITIEIVSLCVWCIVPD